MNLLDPRLVESLTIAGVLALLAANSVPALGQMPPIYKFQNGLFMEGQSQKPYGMTFPNGAVYMLAKVVKLTGHNRLDVFTGVLVTPRPGGNPTTALSEIHCTDKVLYGINSDGSHDGKVEFKLTSDDSNAGNSVAKALCGQEVTELKGAAATNACEALGNAKSYCNEYLAEEAAGGETLMTHRYTEQEFKAAAELTKDCNWDIVQANSKKNDALLNNNPQMAQYYANLIDRLKAQQQKDGNCLGVH